MFNPYFFTFQPLSASFSLFRPLFTSDGANTRMLTASACCHQAVDMRPISSPDQPAGAGAVASAPSKALDDLMDDFDDDDDEGEGASGGDSSSSSGGGQADAGWMSSDAIDFSKYM